MHDVIFLFLIASVVFLHMNIDMLQDGQWEWVSLWSYFHTIIEYDKLVQFTCTAEMKDLGAKILVKAVQGENEMHFF